MHQFSITLTQWYRTKLRAMIPNANYINPIILKFKTFIYKRNCKIIYNFIICGCNTPPKGLFFLHWYVYKKCIKIRKTDGWIIYLWLLDPNSPIFFIINKKIWKEMSFRNVLENHPENWIVWFLWYIYDNILLILKSSALFWK